MIHLGEEDIYRLAEMDREGDLFSDEDLKMMDHLAECEDCYKDFCGCAAWLKLTSVEGAYILSEIYRERKEHFDMVDLQNKAATVVNVIVKGGKQFGQIVMEQVSGMKTLFQFEMSPAFAARGMDGNNGHIVKMEEIEKENTMIMFYQDSSEIYVQIDLRFVDDADYVIFLQSSGGTVQEIPLIRNGNLLYAVTTVPKGKSFSVVISKN